MKLPYFHTAVIISILHILLHAAEDTTMSFRYSYEMDIQAKVDAYLLQFSPLFEFGNTDYGIGIHAGGGGNFWRHSSGEPIDKKKVMFQAGAKFRTKNIMWKLYYESARSQLPLSYVYNDGVVLAGEMPFEKITVSNRIKFGTLFIADSIEQKVFQNVLEITGNLYFTFDKSIDYNFEVGNITNVDYNDNLFSLHLSFPIGLFNRAIQIKPQVVYVEKYLGSANELSEIVTDFADISKVPVERNEVKGDFSIICEFSARIFPLKPLHLLYVSDLFLATYFDVGYYLPEAVLVKNGTTSYSAGAGAGLNMFQGVSSMQIVYGFNHHSKWHAGFVITKNM